MNKINIVIGGKKFKVQVAETDEEKQKGFQGVTSLPEDEGMLFIFNEPDEISFWMKDTKIPLDIIFINEDLEVISVYQGIPESEEFMTENNVNFVLEVNQNSGIKVGDELELLVPYQIEPVKFKIETLWDSETDEEINAVNPGKQGQTVKMNIPIKAQDNWIIRREK